MAESSKRSISDYFSKSTVVKKVKPCHQQDDMKSFESSHSTSEYSTGTKDTEVSDTLMDASILDSEISSEPFSAVNENSIAEPTDLSSCISYGPRQPHLKVFPFRKYGDRNRNFQSSWYALYPWLEYSAETDSAFCFACRKFGTSHMKETEKLSFVNTGYSNWKRATENHSGLKKHENSLCHKNCMVSWESYKQMQIMENTSVASQLSAAHAKEVKKNREYIMEIADVLRLTATQGIAQRGHDESASSTNQGNFLEILHHVAKRDPELKKRLDSGPKNAKYTHHTVQNSILHIFSHLTVVAISNEVKEAKYFAVIADESKDISKTEQLSIVIRYCLNGQVHERFLGFHPAEKLDASSLVSYIKLTLTKCQIDLHNCVAQAYDGANVMSGSCNGVQALFKKEVPQAIYVHCFNHRLNLVIVDACKSIKTARNFFLILQKLYIFLSGSVTHIAFLKAQEKLGISKTELKQLSDTRWTCQFSSCSAVKKTFPAILVTLFQCRSENNDRGVTAEGLLKELNLQFLFNLCFFYELLKQLKIASDYLQHKQSDIANAITVIQTCIDKFSEMRNCQDEFDKIWKECRTIADNNNIGSESECTRPTKLPAYLKEFITENPHAEEISLSCPEHYRLRVLIPVLDTVINEMARRFTDNSSVLEGICALEPDNKSFLDMSKLKCFAEHYSSDVDSVEMEVKLLPKLIKRYKEENKYEIHTLPQLLTLLTEYRLAFHELHKMAVIAVTIPVSSASCERSFSCLRRLKSYLRNTMANERISDLALLAVEKETVKQVDLAAVVEAFDSEHQNRRIRLH